MSAIPYSASLLPRIPEEWDPPLLKAAGTRPMPEESQETGPPPAAAARADRVFEVTGTLLMLVIVVSALFILIRGRWP